MTRRRQISPEEEALWRKATRDVARYRPLKPIVEPTVSPAQGQKPLRQRLFESAAPAGPRGHSGPSRADLFASGDPKMDRLASRGRLDIDAVLDLHGHTQMTARMVLHRFIHEGYARRARCLLVITGKGGGAAGAVTGGPGRGVLRANFRAWLNDDAVCGLIARAAPAHQRHGGDGAFYIFLKRA